MPTVAERLVLWATHPGFRAGTVLLDVQSSWPNDLRIVLEPDVSIEVAVLDTEGRPAAGALIEQFGVTPRFASKTDQMTEKQARRLLAFSETTGSEGKALFGALPGEQVFVASRGNERSVPWRGTAQQRVVLSLHPTFTVGGEVSMPSWEDLDYIGERRITIAAQSRNLWRSLHTIRSAEPGSWGPVLLPLLDVDRYRIRLEGSPIIPVEQFFQPPRSGASLTIDLVTEIGENVWFRVTDQEGQVIPEAVVKVLWQEPGRPDHWNFVERSCIESGQINIWSLPLGAMMFEASAKGYVPFRSGIELTSVYADGYAPISLAKAGRLTGQCLHAGEPVRDFQVLVWQPELGNLASSTEFFDRDEGTFELDTVPQGAFWVTASSAKVPGGEPVKTSCPPGGTAMVTLELPLGLVGRGQVVDAETGESVPGASIQMYVKGGIVPVARWGTPWPVEGDGTFELGGFQLGQNHLRVLAPGYSTKVVQKVASAGQDIDWDVLPLARTQAFRIALDRTDKSNPVEVSGKGAQFIEAREFPSDNTVVFESVSEGHYLLSFEDGKGIGTTAELNLKAGEEWFLRERIDGANQLSIECRNADGSPAPRHLMVYVSYLSSQGYRHVRSLEVARGSCEVSGIDSDTVSVEVLDFDSDEKLAVSGGSFAGGQLHLVIPLGGEPFDLLVVDRDGEPLAGVRVLVMDPTTPGMALFGGTDEKGECRILGVPQREVRVNLQHGPRSHFGIPLDASVRSAELVLDAEAALDLRLVDGEVPLPGASFVIIDDQGTALLNEATADSSGHAVLAGLGADHYSIRAWRSDCWTVVTRVEARVGGEPTPLQLRRVGDLELQVVTAGGLPVSGLAVRLASIEFGAAVEDWIEAERVRSAGLTTDLQGKIVVERLPHGSYRWELTPPDGERLEGELVVVPAQRSQIRIPLSE